MTETKIVSMKIGQVRQIWYDEKTRRQVADCFEPHCNERLTPFFENSVIYDLCTELLPTLDREEWFGVLSPQFFSKAATGAVRPPILRQKIQQEIDLIGFHRSENKNIITQGDNWHGKTPGTFSRLVQEVLRGAGVDWDVQRPLRFPVLMNYAIARAWVWEKYFNEVLKPCMDYMESAEGDFRERLWADAAYHKSRSREMQWRLMDQIGVPHYPFHTFICERLWSVFLEMNWDLVKKKRYWE